MTDADLTAIIGRANERELLATRSRLIEDKKRIEGQISADKFDMMGERAELLNGGMAPREAQLRATSSGDTDWRQRAVHAGIRIDGQLAKVKMALAEIRRAQQETKDPAASGDARRRHEQWDLFLALATEELAYSDTRDISDEGCTELARRAVRMQNLFETERGAA